MKDEIKMSPFLSILADETTNISCKAQFSLVYCYIFNGNVIGRFICFDNVSDDESTCAISSLILKHFANCGTKLVAQTYDGAADMFSALNGVPSKIRDVYPLTLFVHCSANVLNLVLSQSVHQISTCQVFFCIFKQFGCFLYTIYKANKSFGWVFTKTASSRVFTNSLK